MEVFNFLNYMVKSYYKKIIFTNIKHLWASLQNMTLIFAIINEIVLLFYK